MAYADEYEGLIARTYDAVYAVLRASSGDAAFYAALAATTGGPMLELGCGTGRILLPIARAGVACIGLDPSRAMLDALRAKQPPANLEIVEGHMQAFDLGDRRFPLITAPFRVISHLMEVDQQLSMLACVRRHLAPGGIFAFDLFDPRPELMAVRDEPEHVAATFRDGGHEFQRWDAITRDATRQVITLRIRFQETGASADTGGGTGAHVNDRTGRAEIHLRWFHRFELEHLLARAGFTIVDLYGGFDRRRWAAGGETVIVARASA